MSVSVFLSNQIVQIAVGTRGKKGSVKNIYTALAPEGSIINGIVMDQEAFVSFLRQFWSVNTIPTKDVYLIVNSNKIAGKNVEVPVMNEKKTLSYIMREFSDMQREEAENTIAYAPLGQDKKSKIRKTYAEIAQKDQLAEYLQIFDEAGIELKGIVSSESSIIGYAAQTLAPKYGSFVLQIENGNLVYNVLFVNGEYKYYNSVRCFNEYGTPEYYNDCVRSLSQLSQFMQVEKIQGGIERILIAGFNNPNTEAYKSALYNAGIDAPVDILNPAVSSDNRLNFEAQKALFAVSGLYDQGKYSNFLNHFSAKEDSKSVDPRLKGRLITIFGTLIAMLVIFGVCLTLRLILESRYDELKSFNNSATTKMQVAEYDAAVEERDALVNKYSSINNVVETVESYPVCTDEIIDVLEETARGYANIEILSFDAEAGQVTFSAKSDEVQDIYKYIDKLLAEDIFRSVDHTGYTLESDGQYDIHVTCTLVESAGREEE